MDLRNAEMRLCQPRSKGLQYRIHNSTIWNVATGSNPPVGSMAVSTSFVACFPPVERFHCLSLDALSVHLRTGAVLGDCAPVGNHARCGFAVSLKPEKARPTGSTLQPQQMKSPQTGTRLNLMQTSFADPRPNGIALKRCMRV